ncbi:MAG: hypothetical protein ACYC5Q_02095 [Thermoleophilia bacterium]
MIERSVKRVMLGTAIASAAVLTALAVAGLVVTSRGPQAQALPLVRTLIAEADAGDSAGAGTSPGPENDNPQPSWPSELGATTTRATTAMVATLAETAETGSAIGTSRRSPPTTAVRPSSGITPPSTSAGTYVTPLPSANTSTTAPRTTSTTDRVEAARGETGDGHDREVIQPALRVSDDDHHED